MRPEHRPKVQPIVEGVAVKPERDACRRQPPAHVVVKEAVDALVASIQLHCEAGDDHVDLPRGKMKAPRELEQRQTQAVLPALFDSRIDLQAKLREAAFEACRFGD